MKSMINIVFDILESWANRAEIKKHKSMIEENDKLISQVEYIIERKEEIIDKGRLIKSDKGTYITLQKNVDYEDAKKIKTDLESLKRNLSIINGYYNDIIKSYSTKLPAKQEIISETNNRILIVWNGMLNVTDGLSPRDYIYKYLPEEHL